MDNDDKAREEAFKDLADHTAEHFLAWQTVVCVPHMRFVPCHQGTDASPCLYSGEPSDVAKVRQYHEESDGYWP